MHESHRTPTFVWDELTPQKFRGCLNHVNEFEFAISAFELVDDYVVDWGAVGGMASDAGDLCPCRLQLSQYLNDPETWIRRIPTFSSIP